MVRSRARWRPIRMASADNDDLGAAQHNAGTRVSVLLTKDNSPRAIHNTYTY